jgi:hypothetical protein
MEARTRLGWIRLYEQAGNADLVFWGPRRRLHLAELAAAGYSLT